jgi:chorismate lyase / 3-hydroxybenzoate synthase
MNHTVYRFHLPMIDSKTAFPLSPTFEALEEALRESQPATALIHFGNERSAPASAIGSIPLEQLTAPRLVERWSSNQRLERLESDGFIVVQNAEVMLGAFTADGGAGVDRSSRAAYDRMLRLTREHGFPHFLRIWNHLPSINEEECGLERYKLFSSGRHDAFGEAGYALAGDLPAASAVGSHRKGLSIYFLAARAPGIQIENPRQVSAFAYPPQYGPQSPSFSRATVKEWPAGWQIFISGTASIVGHESMHPGALELQVEETLRNIELVLESSRAIHRRTIDLQSLRIMKVYLRPAEHLTRVQRVLGERISTKTGVMIVEADICRRELLVEIEAIAEVER